MECDKKGITALGFHPCEHKPKVEFLIKAAVAYWNTHVGFGAHSKSTPCRLTDAVLSD